MERDVWEKTRENLAAVSTGTVRKINEKTRFFLSRISIALSTSWVVNV